MSLHQMVTFYIPLASPLRIPAADGIWLEREEHLDWLRQYFPHSKWKLPAELYGTGHAFVLLRVNHLLSGKVGIDISAVNRAFLFASKDTQQDFPDIDESISESISIDTGPEPVIVESCLALSTPLLAYDVAPLDFWISEAFDRCIDSARRFEMAYAIESGDLSYMPLTRVTCHPQVPYALYDFVENSWSGLGLFAPNYGEAFSRDFGTYLPSEQMARLKVRFGRISREDPWHVFISLSRAANRSLEIEGDFASAVIQAYTAGESMLDTLLQSMAWESIEYGGNTALSTDQVVSWFSQRSTLVSRMNNVFPSLLRHWNMGNQEGACYQWSNHAADLRNRIVHGGYEPKESQVRIVVDLLRELEFEVKEILLRDENRCRYAKTVFLWIGRNGLISRSLYTGQLKRLDEANLERDWVGEFIAFRKTLDQRLWPSTGPVG